MPSPTYQQNKRSIYNYREKNKEKYKSNYTISNMKINAWLKGKREFLAILRADCVFVD
jgi:hypothetical protein